MNATHLKFLVNDAKLFDDYIDVYMNAAVFGYLYSKKDSRDNESKDRARIYSDAFSTHRSECIMLYRLIMLLDEQDINLEERLNRAFRYDSNAAKEEELKECMELFNSYVLGGIEYMFDMFTAGCTSRDDYIRTSSFIKKSSKIGFVGADLIYDYFSQILENEKDTVVHNEWLKAEHALSKTEDDSERKIIKSLLFFSG